MLFALICLRCYTYWVNFAFSLRVATLLLCQSFKTLLSFGERSTAFRLLKAGERKFLVFDLVILALLTDTDQVLRLNDLRLINFRVL